MELVPIGKIKPNPSNPRIIKDIKFQQLKKSLESFPDMAKVRPIVVNQDMVVLGGNMRLKAMKEAGWKEVPIEVVDWPEEKQREFIIKDNVGFGEWDWELIAADWPEVEEWGLDVPGFDTEKKLLGSDIVAQKLTERFAIPPFSVLDTRQGYWQDRKKTWNELIGDNGESREETLFKSKGNPVSDALRTFKNGVSILDPVLAEITNMWFGLPNSKTFDPFAGDSIFGYVSSYMGNQFTGIELRQEQADLNNTRVKEFTSKYICDDGQNVLKHIEENSQDLLFSCPPYFDLEVYSDLQNDASNQKEYKGFLQILDNAFTDAIKCLRDNRFAVITVGDVRDKKSGFYYRFVDDIKDIFKRSGMLLYNELILVEAIGGARLRVGGLMKSRKIAKTHQNILVFYRGKTSEIKNIFPLIEITEEDVSTDAQF